MRTRRQFLSGGAAWLMAGQAPRRVFIVPNFHPASCGWLTNFSKERVYCANSYFDHLDRVRDDPAYRFVLSEVNNMIAMLNFQPARAAELRRRIRERRVELVNAFFLESTINLSGGEALVRLGIEGLRWQERVFGRRPRFAWLIDVCGTHDQMAQITARLGLEAMVYCRKNPTGSALHWTVSPDGSRVLTFSPGHYSRLRELFRAEQPLNEKQLAGLEKDLEERVAATPAGAPVLVLAGSGDYSLAPARREQPRDFIAHIERKRPELRLQLATLSDYLDALPPATGEGKLELPEMKGGTAYDYNAFWIQCPRMKSWFRRNEHALHAAESLASIASLTARFAYPAARLYHAWLQMFLCMDRNTLWGGAGGMVFEHPTSWDARDRLEWVESAAADVARGALGALAAPGEGRVLYNPLNWGRSDPVALRLPADAGIEGAACQLLGDGSTLCRIEQPAAGLRPVRLKPGAAATPRQIALPEVIETSHYAARIDPATGAIASLRFRGSGREIFAAPANRIVAERATRPLSGGDHMQPRGERAALGDTGQVRPEIRVTTGPVAIEVTVESRFLDSSACLRRVRFHLHHPRIDFETELRDIPDQTVVLAEFPLAGNITQVRRGVPYGFSHGAWGKPDPALHGWTAGITPAVRFSHYSLSEGWGLAIFDRGLSGRELTGNTPVLFLMNAVEKYRGYPNPWLSGKGVTRVVYALLAHESAWDEAAIARRAFEFNAPPILLEGVSADREQTFLETSGNLIVESLRRTGTWLEVRAVECLGRAGEAEVRLPLAHRKAFLTNLAGEGARELPSGPAYRFRVQPQEIVTLRFQTTSAVADPPPLLEWDELAPAPKRAALRAYSSEKGHPPRGD